MIKLTKTSIVKNILAGYPSLSATDVARKAKCDVSIVYQIKSKMKADLAKATVPDQLSKMVVRGANGIPVKIRMGNLTEGASKSPSVISPSGLLRLQVPKEVDMVNNPPHYTVGGIETIDFIKAKLTTDEYKGFLKGTILAYASRVGHKEGTDDAGKIGWYAKKLQEL